jgi:hypothetical protein
MPLRVAKVLLALFAACVAIVGLAWVFDGQLYMLLPPGRHYRHIERPPTHPAIIMVGLAFCVGFFSFFSRRWGVMLFTVLFAGIVLGSVVGYLVFAWTPTLVQWLLAFAMGAETWYAWSTRGECFDD